MWKWAAIFHTICEIRSLTGGSFLMWQYFNSLRRMIFKIIFNRITVQMSTAISPWQHQFSSDHWSQARLRPVSTWMGDRLGIQVAVDLLRGRAEFFWSIWNNQSVFKADAPNCWNLICHTGLRVCLNDQAYTAWIHFLRGVYHKSSSEDCKLSCWPMKVAKSSESFLSASSVPTKKISSMHPLSSWWGSSSSCSSCWAKLTSSSSQILYQIKTYCRRRCT